VATNRLSGTNVHLVFTFIRAAAGGCHSGGDPHGDLYRMLHNNNFVARPIDGRAGYTRQSFTDMLQAIIGSVQPNYIRTQSSIGHRDQGDSLDHVDHTSGAILAADADTYANGNTWIRRDEYLGYSIRHLPDNVFGYWQTRKIEIWEKYWPEDPELNSWDWRVAMARQYRPEGRIFWPNTPWVGPGDFYVQSCG
jgi:hypothetical protein